VKYACIARHVGEFSVRLMCRVLEVTTQGYYLARSRPESSRKKRDRELRVHVRASHERSRRTYGAPRVHQDLKAAGQAVAKKRVARLMQEDDLVARRRRRYVATTDSRHGHPVAPNLLDREFGVTQIAEKNRVWASDITYIPTREGFLYLAVVIDLVSRRVVGWALRDTLDAGLVLFALRMALAHRRPGSGVLHHSDRGSQYASAEYRALLKAHGMVASMSKKGDCWDNAVVESFFSTLELELILQSDWTTRAEAKPDVFRYIEGWYNIERRHSTLGYRSPAQYEAEVLGAAGL
jgi:putative transposase